MPAHTTSEQSHRITPGRLWFGTVGAGIAWACQGFTCFLISTQACANGTGDWGPLSGVGVRILLACITVLYLSVAVASGIISYRNWQSLSDQRRLFQAEGIPRENFMALIGVFVGAASVVGLIWAGIPFFLIDVCNSFR